MNAPQIVPQSEAQASAPQPDYHSFLLRMWLVKNGIEVRWRASLEEVQSGEVKGFRDVEDLLTHLAGLTEQRQDQEAGPGSSAPPGQAEAPPS